MIRFIIPLVIATLAFSAVARSAPGDTLADPIILTGQVGCTLAWNYPETRLADVRAFGLVVDNQPAQLIAAPATAISCDEAGLVEPGKRYRLKLNARPKSPKAFSASPLVHVVVTLEPAPVTTLPVPTGLRLLIQ